jgi:hypothetical protein
MTAGQTNLLTSVSETDVTTDKDRAIFGAPAGATVVKRISICGDRHLSALISAVVDRYPVPETAAAFGMMGPVLDDVPIGVDEVIEALAADGKEHKVTFIKAGENMLGASLLTAIEGRLFPTTHPECIAAYFPKGATRKGYGIRRGSVLDIVPGYDTHTLKARVDAVLDGLPKLAELTKDDLVALPRGPTASTTTARPPAASAAAVWPCSASGRSAGARATSTASTWSRATSPTTTSPTACCSPRPGCSPASGAAATAASSWRWAAR